MVFQKYGRWRAVGTATQWLFCSFASGLMPMQAQYEGALTPASVSSVSVEGGFWGPRFTTNAEVTLPHNYEFLESTGRITNFDRAAGLNHTPFRGGIPHDSDVFKILEGAAHTLQVRPDLVDKEYYLKQVSRVIAAQEPDGFLCAKLSLEKSHARWDDLRHSHVLYNAGHFFEAAVAHHEATGETNFLQAAERFADLIDQRFGPDKVEEVPGHQEIELALAKLYRATGNERYLKLSDFFLNQRGRWMADGDTRPRYADYNQNRIPLKDEEQVVGHAVRAGYTYAAMADMQRFMGDAGYGPALQRLWEDMVGGKMYITGGSASGQYYDEGAGDAYHLPNESAYCETCGTIASVLWSHRMALLHADANYVDVLERALYNGVLSGMALTGDRFFYVNKQASRSGAKRSPSYNPACCQSNLVRIIPQVGSMGYATRGNDLFINLFMAGNAKLGDWQLKVETDYPWNGKVRIQVKQAPPEAAQLALRIPGWAREQPVPSSLYHFAKTSDQPFTISTSWWDTAAKPQNIQDGYVKISRRWNAGDFIELNLPMPVRRVLADERVKANHGRVALQRGPLVYCVEQIDHDGLRTNALVLNEDVEIEAVWQEDLLGGVMLLKTDASALYKPAWGKAPVLKRTKLTAIPYYAWANRELGSMDIWLARSPEVATPVPTATADQSAKVTTSVDAIESKRAIVNDAIWGPRSYYRYTPRLVLSGERSSKQWIQYEWPEARKLSRAAVFWAVDHRSQVYWWKRIRGEDLGVPESWRLLYRDGDKWIPVQANPSPFSPFPYTLRLDLFNLVEFTPVTTKAIRMEATLGVAPCAVQELRVGYREVDSHAEGSAVQVDEANSPFDPQGF